MNLIQSSKDTVCQCQLASGDIEVSDREQGQDDEAPGRPLGLWADRGSDQLALSGAGDGPAKLLPWEFSFSAIRVEPGGYRPAEDFGFHLQ